MAQAEYGISDELIEEANNKIPDEFQKVLSKTKKSIQNITIVRD